MLISPRPLGTVIAMATPASFPLRLRDERLRRLVRELADNAHMSQNEFIEVAIEHEVVVLGALVAGELASAARRLGELTDQQMAALADRSVEAFVEGEAARDPLQATALHTHATSQSRTESDRLGVLAAFDAGRR